MSVNFSILLISKYNIMSNIFMLLSTAAFILFIIGLFNPKASLFWMSNKEKRKRGKSCVIYISIWLVAAFIGGPLSNSDDAKKIPDIDLTQSVDSNVVDKETIENNNWSYSEKKDEMSEKMMYFATCTSTDIHEFKFPYNGGSCLYLTVRNINNKNEVVLQISKGQIMNSVSNDEYVRFKFDGGEPVKYYFSGSSDGDSKYAFIEQSASLIKKLKSAKKIKIDVPLYQEGRPVFNFDVSGLKWNH